MRQCAEAGYPIRIMLMPIIPIADWQRHYDELLEQLLTRIPVDRITLGGVCSYGPAIQIMEAKLGKDNLISRSLTVIDNGPDDGRVRYPERSAPAGFGRRCAVPHQCFFQRPHAGSPSPLGRGIYGSRSHSLAGAPVAPIV